MASPNGPVTLTVEQIDELRQTLRHMRHEVNGKLSLIVAAAELVRLNPDKNHKMWSTLIDQPPVIRDRMNEFSAEIEKLISNTKEGEEWVKCGSPSSVSQTDVSKG